MKCKALVNKTEYIRKLIKTINRIVAMLMILVIVVGNSGCSEKKTYWGVSVNGGKDFQPKLILYPDADEDTFFGDRVDVTKLQKDKDYMAVRDATEYYELATETHIVPYLLTTIGNSLYYITMEGESTEKCESYTLWCRNFEGSSSEEKILELAPEQKVVQMTVDEARNIYIFTKTRVDELHDEIAEYYLTKYNATGDELWQKKVTEDIIQDEEPTQEDLYCDQRMILYDECFFNKECYYSVYDIISARVDKEGVLYAVNGRGLAIFDSDGNKTNWIGQNEFLSNRRIIGIAHGRNDILYVVYGGDDMYGYAADADYAWMISDEGMTEDNISSFLRHRYTGYDSTYIGEVVFSAGLNYDMLTKSDYELFGCDFESGTAKKLLYWANCGLNGEDVDYMAELEDGRILAISHCFDEGPVEAAVIGNVKTVQDYGRDVVTFGANWMDNGTQRAVAEFNKQNEDCKVLYGEIEDFENISDKSELDVFSIDGSSPVAEQYVAEGKIENLIPYFETSSKISVEDFLEPVVEAHTYDGVLVGLPSRVYMRLMEKTSVGENAGWTLTELMEMVESDPSLKERLDASTVAYTLAYYNYSKYIDWEDVNCKFASENPAAQSGMEMILTYANTFPIESSVKGELPEGFMTPAVDWHSIGRIGDVSSAITKGYVSVDSDEEQDYVGVLRDSGMTFCISSSCKNKEETWKLLEFLYSTSVKSSFRFGTVDGYVGGLPTRKDKLERETRLDIEEYDKLEEYWDTYMQLISEAIVLEYNSTAPILAGINDDLIYSSEDTRMPAERARSMEWGIEEYLENYREEYD